MNNLPNYIAISFSVLGSLALFLFAMKALSSSLQNVIGEKIEFVLRKLTDRPYKGMITGTLVTFLTQSSSITVLTLIGLVNVGALTLRQGVGIILGSEIGTTMTAQLVTLQVELLYFPLLVIGFVLTTFIKNKDWNNIGKVIFAFGLLFLGMELMKKGASPLKESPFALSLFEQLGRIPLLGIIVGTLFTTVTSSSSATTSLVVALGAANAISLPAAIALILGANIGTCALELIAAVGLSLTSKRVAAAQAVINVLGVVIIFPFIRPFANLMTYTSSSLPHQIANAHTVFNVGSSLLFLIVVNWIVLAVEKLVPGEDIRVERGLKYIESSLLSMPHIALVNAVKEVQRAGEMVLLMADCVRRALVERRDDLIEVIQTYENQVDFLNAEISRYLMAVSEHELDQVTSERLAQLLHGISDIERGSDHLNRVAEEMGNPQKLGFSRSEREEIGAYMEQCASIFGIALTAFIEQDPAQAEVVAAGLAQIREMQRSILKSARRGKGKRGALLQILHNMERLGNHADNLAQIAVSGF